MKDLTVFDIALVLVVVLVIIALFAIRDRELRGPHDAHEDVLEREHRDLLARHGGAL